MWELKCGGKDAKTLGLVGTTTKSHWRGRSEEENGKK
jgi:hypothetical protein